MARRRKRLANQNSDAVECLRVEVHREFQPSGRVQTFLCDRIVYALAGFRDAEPGKLNFDPMRRTQEEILDCLYAALRELNRLQAR